MGSVTASLSRASRALLPQRLPTTDEERVRLHFAAVMSWLAVASAIGLGAMSFLVGAPTAGWFTLFSVVPYSIAAIALKRGASARLGFWVTCLTTFVLFLAAQAAQVGLDLALVAWCTLFPVATTLFGGPRLGLIGLGLGATCAAGLYFISGLGLGTDVPDAALSTVRLASFMGCTFLLSGISARLRLAALAEARAAAQARTYFLASMSHEFRTPMNGVIGLAETMLERPRSIEDHEALNLIKRSGHQLVELINDVIDLARVDSGRLSVKAEPTDIRGLIADAIELTRAAFSSTQVAVRIDITSDVPAWVLLDPLRVRQVVTNLLGNALKFTRTGEVVTAVSAGTHLVVEVRDTGIGIPTEAVERIFHPFERAHSSAAGSGLGLAITRQLVELMGGTVALASEVGRGTRASVRLPLVITSVPPKAPPPAPLKPFLGAQRTALIVDDNEINLRVAMALVRRAGYHPISATSGIEALAAVREHHFDVILMDCHMPDMDGFEAARRIRALDTPAAKTPIIAVTASSLPEEQDLCFQVGMNACTIKPLTLQDLEHAFGRALSASA